MTTTEVVSLIGPGSYLDIPFPGKHACVFHMLRDSGFCLPGLAISLSVPGMVAVQRTIIT